MKIIGLTGGIGSGKSTVAKYLAEIGASIIDMDKLGHEVLKKGTKAYRQVVDAFGKKITNKDGEIDRIKLGKIVFENKTNLSRLNNIVHPAIDEIMEYKINELQERGEKVAILDAAVILEAGKAALANEIWVTTASEATVLQRLGKRSGYSEEASKERIQAQLPDEERFKHADVIINTDCSLDELKAKVMVEWQKLLKRL